MKLFGSFCIAFSMYSRIPVPQVEWKEEHMRYCMCFFPVIGIVLGGMLYVLAILGIRAGITPGFLAALLTVLPVLVTGGIHLDGYLDTSDARASYGDREKKLAILKDSHVGAFAVIACAVYFILTYGSWQGLLEGLSGRGDRERILGALAVCPMLSRAFSGMAVVCFQPAKNSGFVAMFSDAARKRIVRITMAGYLLCGSACTLIWGRGFGALVLLACAGTFGYYYRLSRKEFGGITGDLAGYYVCLAELAILLLVTAGVMIGC